MHKGDLGSIPRPMEHALAEERAPQRNTVKPAHQVAAFVNLETMAVTPLVKLAIEHADAGIDPGARSSGLGRGTAVEHSIEVSIDGDAEAIGAHRAREPTWHVEALDGNDAALLRLDPVERRVVRALRHGKDAAGIGLKQDLRRDFNERAFAVGHAILFRRRGTR